MLDGDCSDLDHNLSKDVDGTENDGKKQEEFDQENVFEPGCVLVEFRRTEASCMTQHIVCMDVCTMTMK